MCIRDSVAAASTKPGFGCHGRSPLDRSPYRNCGGHSPRNSLRPARRDDVAGRTGEDRRKFGCVAKQAHNEDPFRWAVRRVTRSRNAGFLRFVGRLRGVHERPRGAAWRASWRTMSNTAPLAGFGCARPHRGPTSDKSDGGPCVNRTRNESHNLPVVTRLSSPTLAYALVPTGRVCFARFVTPIVPSLPRRRRTLPRNSARSRQRAGSLPAGHCRDGAVRRR